MNIGKLSRTRPESSFAARVLSYLRVRLDEPAFATFLFLSSCYLSANLILRWMKWAIFDSTGLFGFSLHQNSTETVYLTYMVSVPVFVWGMLLYLSGKAIPVMKNWVLLFALLFLATVFIELDAAWYGLSRRHASWAEIEMFMTEDLQAHFGIQLSHILHYAAIFSVHFTAFAAFLVFSVYFARHDVFAFFRKISLATVMGALTLFVSFDVAGSIYMRQRSVDHWHHLIDRNLLSPGILPQILSVVFGDSRDLDAANADLAEIAKTSTGRLLTENQAFLDGAPRHPVPAAKLKDILILTVEGFNPSLVDAETMPFYTSLEKKGIVGRNHYSVANITLYGILGLLFGEPLNFYESADGNADSPFVDLLARHGYTSRVISTDLSNYRHMTNYMRNFTNPWMDRENWWDLSAPIAEELAQDGPNFVLSYYNGTHYPYQHDDKYRRFLPEVPKDFIYSSDNLHKNKEKIRNRYRNCLLEADAWLKHLMSRIDLDRTVIVITGDHGEEFFENGRLSHASNLGEPQIRTPFLMLAPGAEPKVIEGRTSHLNIMAAALAMAGLGNEKQTPNDSALHALSSDTAIVVHSNGIRLPNRWAIITKDRKSEVTADSEGKLRITALYDLADRKIDYRSDRAAWRENLEKVAAFQRFLDKSQKKVVLTLE